MAEMPTDTNAMRNRREEFILLREIEEMGRKSQAAEKERKEKLRTLSRITARKRTEAGLSREFVAGRMGITPEELGSYELGQLAWDRGSLARFVDALAPVRHAINSKAKHRRGEPHKHERQED